jgi:hypothetical protein
VRNFVTALAAISVLATGCSENGDEQGRPLPPQVGPVMLSCDGPPFPPSALESPLGAENEDNPAAAALRAKGPPGPWRELSRTEDAVLYSRGPDLDPNRPREEETLEAYLVTRVNSVWAIYNSGGCLPERIRRGVGHAEWWPSVPPSARTKRFTALVNATACSGGRSAESRIYEPEIDYGDEAVVVTFWVEPLPTGIYTCPGNPPAGHDVRLRVPLGDRRLLDGGIYPPREPVIPEKG